MKCRVTKKKLLLCAVMLMICYAVVKPLAINSAALNGKILVSMDMTVAEANRSPYTDGHFVAIDYDVLHIAKASNTITVYAWVFYGEYSYDGTSVKTEQASHIPTVVTFDAATSENSSTYDLLEYWIPGDGDSYASDIRAKFPITLWLRTFNGTGAKRQAENCMQAAQKYYGVADI